jgi:hypothetical protein
MRSAREWRTPARSRLSPAITRLPLFDTGVHIAGFAETVAVIQPGERPRMMTIVGSDQRMMQFLRS